MAEKPESPKVEIAERPESPRVLYEYEKERKEEPKVDRKSRIGVSIAELTADRPAGEEIYTAQIASHEPYAKLLRSQEAIAVHSREAAMHNASEPVYRELAAAGNATVELAETKTAELKDRLDETSLMSRVLEPTETILGRVRYREILFLTRAGDEMFLPEDVEQMPGFIAITDRRVFFMSSNKLRDLDLKVTDRNKKGKPAKYDFKYRVADSLWFYPVPLTSLKHVQIAAVATVDTESNVYSVPPCCDGSCGCFFCCCPDARKRWFHRSPYSFNKNNRTMIIEMTHPAWPRYELTVRIKVEMSESIDNMCSFVAAFQDVVYPSPTRAEGAPGPRAQTMMG